MADQMQVDRADVPTDNMTATATGEMPSPKLSKEREQATKKRSLVRRIVVAMAIALAVAGFFMRRYLNSYEATDDAQVDGHINNVSARVSGYVLKVNVDDNQTVEKGAVLVEIDPRDYQVALERAKAELADAEATAQAMNLNVPVETIGTTTQVSSSEADLQAAQAGVAAARGQLNSARAQLEQAEANNARAQADVARYSALVAKDEVSKQLYDQAEAAAKANAAAVEGAHAGVAAVEQQIAQAESRVNHAQAALQYSQTGPQQVAATQARARAAIATVQQKRAALDKAQLDLQYCTITAPVTGVVNKRVEVGMNVQPGQTLLSVVPLDDVWITANFKETQLRRMKIGQRVTISVDAYGREYQGRVESIAGATGAQFSLLPPENATGNYVKVVQRVPVKIVLDAGENREHLLRLGMSVEPKIWLR
ncbi:MAG: HlyD family secretion protein [Acidobacteria bacterium]|nr:MAG: HlyD family secretion protein [Acidobacteriota bacterium]